MEKPVGHHRKKKKSKKKNRLAQVQFATAVMLLVAALIRLLLEIL